MIDLESDVNGSKSESQQTSQSGPGPEHNVMMWLTLLEQEFVVVRSISC